MNFQLELKNYLLSKLFYLLILLFFGLNPYFSYGNKTRFNPDSLIGTAQKLIAENKYELARKDLQKALKDAPDYQDVLLIISRTFAFENKNDSASIYLEKARTKGPDNYALREWDVTFNFWQKNHEKVITKSSAALSLFENDTNFRLLKAKSLYELKRYKEAVPILQALHEELPENEDVTYLLRVATVKSMKNQVGFNFGRDFFSNVFPDRSTLQVDWKHERDKIIYNPRFSVANRFSQNSYMAEFDVYPKLREDLYFFLSAGISDGLLFPEQRISVEPFWSFVKNYELSGGIRYLKYPGTSVYLATISLTRYVGNWWLHARFYNGFEVRGNSYVGELAVRRYLKNELQFIELRSGYGSSPDNFYLATNFDAVLGSQALNFILTFQQPIKLRWLFKTWAIVDFQQPNNSENFNIYSINAGLWYRF